MTSSHFETLVVAIADVTLSLSADEGLGDGKARYEHCCENDLNAPCDMLARLGIMVEDRSAMAAEHGESSLCPGD